MLAGTVVALVMLTLYRVKKNWSTPKGIRTPVFAVKGRHPRPLDDGSLHQWVYRDLNPGPIDYESTALTTEL